MNQAKKPNPIRIVVWTIYLFVSLLLTWMAGGFAFLSTKSTATMNIPVVIIAALVALFSIIRIFFELRPSKIKEVPLEDIENIESFQSDEGDVEIMPDEIKICIHCGKAEPLETIYCSSCGNRFPEL
jgi:hypothetical protein